MEIILSIVGLVAALSLYDYFTARRWQQVTSAQRNDLVFEHRNKAYGAYVIRRDYDKWLMIVMGAVVLLVALLWGFYVFWKSLPEPVIEEPKIDMSQFAVVAPPVEEVVPPPPAEEIPPMERAIEFLPPEIVDEPLKELPPPPDENINSGAQTVLVPETFDPGIPDDGPAYVPPSKPDEPELDVDESAMYPGGSAAMREYLARNIHYPEMAMADGIEGKCYLRFVVDREGRISDVRVTRGVPDCSECDAEAKRVVKSMPKWTPGKKGGNAVKSYYDLPVNFKLQ